jgi:hypothetical protein
MAGRKDTKRELTGKPSKHERLAETELRSDRDSRTGLLFFAVVASVPLLMANSWLPYEAIDAKAGDAFTGYVISVEGDQLVVLAGTRQENSPSPDGYYKSHGLRSKVLGSSKR